MRVLHVASEVAPFAQSGGLADVLGGLPHALAARGLVVGVLMPLYRGVEARLTAMSIELGAGTPIRIELGPHSFAAALRSARVDGVTYGFLDCVQLYDRAGGIYGPTGNSDWPDNALRFGALGKAAVEHGHSLVEDEPPDILHVHDWQASPAAIYARGLPSPPAIVTTVHNLAYRGIFPKHVMNDLGWPWSRFTIHDLEFYDQVSFLKGGMASADVVTTVSPSYGAEILTPRFGEALDGFLRSDIKHVTGIVNGIDTGSWDPATDPALAAPFSADDLAGKRICRDAIAAELELPRLAPHQPLIAVIARMTGQKGLDLVADVAPELHRLDAKLVVLGSGEPDFEARFRWLGNVFSKTIAVRIGFDIKLSRRIYAGSDMFLMPSRFEPCGLGQLYAMRYGSVPIVHAVGGLRDTVIDPRESAATAASTTTGTGFAFTPATPAALLTALERAVALFHDVPAFATLRRNAMLRDSSWTVSAGQYLALYRSLRP
jgi:starch synthase